MPDTAPVQTARLPDPAPAATNAEKARALMAMLEPGQAAPAGVSPERLRDWANDLIRTVEGERDAVPEGPAPRRRRLFTKAPPKLTAAPPPEPVRPRVESPPSRLNLTAPMPHAPVAPAASARVPDPSTYSVTEVRKIIDATVDQQTLAREHPAVIAMTLVGRPSMEQAGALRSLPGGHVRAVHKALRQLESNRPPAQTVAAQAMGVSG